MKEGDVIDLIMSGRRLSFAVNEEQLPVAFEEETFIDGQLFPYAPMQKGDVVKVLNLR